MYLSQFLVESYMTEHENNCQYNLTDTCVSPMSIKDLEKLTDLDITSQLAHIKVDYGPIVGSDRLKKAILSLYKQGDGDNITTTIGAINANLLVMMCLLDKGDHVVTYLPTYQQLYSLPESLGCIVDTIELKEEHHWQPTIDDFKEVVSDKTKLICINSPNNPTGTYLDEDMMYQLSLLARKHDAYILCDEVYRDPSQLSFNDIDDRVIVTSSLSKMFSFAGIRMGWIKGPKEIIRQVNYRRDYHVISNGPIDDYLASVVLENKDLILARNNQIINQNKNYLKQWLSKEKHMSCVIPETGTVGFLSYDFDIDSNTFCEQCLRDTGVFFVPGSCFDDDKHLRFGFGNDCKRVKEGLKVLSTWLKQFN